MKVKNEKSNGGGSFPSRKFLEQFTGWVGRFNEHRKRYGDRGDLGPAVGEADVERELAEAGWVALEREFSELGLFCAGRMLPRVFTGNLNGQEFVDLDFKPLCGDSRSYVVPVGRMAEMAVRFQVRKPVAISESGEVSCEWIQPTVEEVSRAIQGLFCWLARGEDLPGLEFGELPADEAAVR
jgi:hypothetical protein